jgi:hypothetical protein
VYAPRSAKKFDLETFNIRKLNQLEIRKHYQINILNRFAALENLNVREDIIRVWENTEENIKTSSKTVCTN